MTQDSPLSQFKVLNDDSKAPTLGLRVEHANENDVYTSVLNALKHGIRHIDVAWFYNNECQAGKAIQDSGIPRDQLFISTKLWSTHHRNPQQALETSLKNLQLDYVDLYLMHWPVSLKEGDKIIPRRQDGSRDIDEDWSIEKTWQLMQDIPKTRAKSIGVANCSTVHLDNLINASTTTVTPVVNEVEIHPSLPQCKLTNYCREKGITIAAYCPRTTSHMALLGHPTIVKLSKKYNAARTDVLASWLFQRGYMVLIKEPECSIFELTEQEVEDIREISRATHARFMKPDWGVDVFYDDA